MGSQLSSTTSKNKQSLDDIIKSIHVYNTFDKVNKRITSILNDVIIYKYDKQKLSNILKHIQQINTRYKVLKSPRSAYISLNNIELNKLLKRIHITKHIKSFNIPKSETKAYHDMKHNVNEIIDGILNQNIFPQDEKPKVLLKNIKLSLKHSKNNNNRLRKLLKGVMVYRNSYPTINKLIRNILILKNILPLGGRQLYSNGLRIGGDIQNKSLQKIKIPKGYIQTTNEYANLQKILSTIKVLIDKQTPSLSESLTKLANPTLNPMEKWKILNNIEQLSVITNNKTIRKVNFKLQHSNIDNVFKSAKKILNSL